jgi:hypothetical protein
MRYGPAWELQRRYHSCGLWRRQAAPDGDRAEAGEIDAVEIGEKAVNEVDAGLLAVADDVDPRVLLPLHREDSRVYLASGERVALEPPCGPQLFRLGEPRGFGRLPATVVANMSAPERAIRAEPLERGGGLGVRNREERSSDRSTNRHCQRTREYRDAWREARNFQGAPLARVIGECGLAPKP